MTSNATMFSVVRDPQPGRPEAIAVIRGRKKIPCPTLDDYLHEVIKVFYDQGGDYSSALQTVAKLSMERSTPGKMQPAGNGSEAQPIIYVSTLPKRSHKKNMAAPRDGRSPP